MGLAPQLRMLRPDLNDLPDLVLPSGYRLRSYLPGDALHWERILAASFGGDPARFSFERIMQRDPAYRPERVLFITAADGTPVATASAWHQAGVLEGAGSVHYVGVVPEAQGQRLGYWMTLATLHHMRREGFRRAILSTDDFRLPAIKTYLRLGFEPLLAHENQRERWPRVFAELGMTAEAARFASILAGPVWQPDSAARR